jgi:hypothetical protein
VCTKGKNRRRPENVIARGSLIFPDPKRIVASKQPRPKAITRRIRNLGPGAILCDVCQTPCANTRGVSIHKRSSAACRIAQRAQEAKEEDKEEEKEEEKEEQEEQGSSLDFDFSAPDSDSEQFEVKEVLDHRGTRKKLEYLV